MPEFKDNNGNKFELKPSSAAEKHCCWLFIHGDLQVFPGNNTGWHTIKKEELLKMLKTKDVSFPDSLHIDYKTAVNIITELAEYFEINLSLL